jgi:hypothetical protein
MHGAHFLVVALLLVSASCEAQDRESDQRDSAETRQVAPESTPTPSVSSSEELPPYAKHFCTGPGIGPLPAEGQFPPPENWRKTSEIVGPVGTDIRQLFAARPAADFRSIGGGHRSYAFAVIVEAGRVATLVIPSAHRDKIMFNLDPGRSGPMVNTS